MPGSTIIGRVAVKVIPDTADFRKRAQADLEKATRNLKVKIPVELDDNDILREVRSTVNRINRVTSRYDSMKIKLHVKLEAGDIREQLDALTRDTDVTLNLDADEAQRDLDRWQDRNNPQEISVHPDLNGAHARGTAARLALLTRPRQVDIIPKINKAALASVGTTLAALSGARVLSDSLDGLWTRLKRLDQMTPKIAAQTLAFLNLGSGIGSLTQHLFALSSGLAQIFPAMLALPGIAGGMAIGLLGTILAFKDFNKELPEVKGKLTDLQDRMSSKFWEKARQPIREFIDTLLPEFARGFEVTGTKLGGFFGKLATELKASLGGELTGMFRDLNQSIDIATASSQSFANIITVLGRVGAGYLPRLAQSFVDLTNKASNWLDTKEQSGELKSMIDNGITQLKALGSVLWNTGGILSDIARAAEKAGGTSLQRMADGLANVNESLGGPAAQGRMTAFFSAMNGGISNLLREGLPGFKKFGDALLGLANTALPQAGYILGRAIDSIGEALARPAITNGISVMLNGIQGMVERLRPAMAPLADALGSLGPVVGALAEAIGSVLAAAIPPLAALLIALAPIVTNLVNLLGAGLTVALETVGPLVQDLASFVTGLMSSFTGDTKVSSLTNALDTLKTSLGTGLVEALDDIGPRLGQLKDVLGGSLSGAFAKVAPEADHFGGILDNLARLLGPIISFLGFYASALVTFWGSAIASVLPQLDHFTEVVGGALGKALDKIGPVLPQVGSALGGLAGAVAPLIGIVGDLAAAIIEVAGNAISRILPALSRLVVALTPVISVIVTVVGFIVRLLIPVLKFLANMIIDSIVGVIDGITSIVEGITSIISGVVDVFTGFKDLIVGIFTLDGDKILGGLSKIMGGFTKIFSGVWDVIKGIIETAWNVAVLLPIGKGIAGLKKVVELGWLAIKEIFSLAWRGIMALVKGNFGEAKALFTASWDAIKFVFIAAWNGIKAVISGAWDLIKAIISGAFGVVKAIFTTEIAVWKSIFSDSLAFIKGIFTGAWDGIKSAASTAMSGVKGVFTGALDGIKSGVSNSINGIKSFFTGAWDSIRLGAMYAWDAIRAYITGLWDSLRLTAMYAWDAVKATISGAWTGIKTVISTALAWVRAIFETQLLTIKTVAQNIWDGIRAVISTAINAAKAIVTGTLNGIRSTFTSVWDGIRGIVGSAINGVKTLISNGLNSAKGLATSAVNGIKTNVTNAFNGIKTFISGAMNNVKTLVSNGFTNAKNAASGKVNELMGIVRQIPGRVTSAIGNLGHILWNAGASVIQGFIDGIKSMFGKVQGALGGLTSKLTSWKGPPKTDAVILTNNGQLVIQGFVKGLVSQFPTVQKTLGGLTRDIPNMFGVDSMRAIGGDAMSSLLSGMRSQMSPLQSFIAEVASEMEQLNVATAGVGADMNLSTAVDYVADPPANGGDEPDSGPEEIIGRLELVGADQAVITAVKRNPKAIYAANEDGKRRSRK